MKYSYFFFVSFSLSLSFSRHSMPCGLHEIILQFNSGTKYSMNLKNLSFCRNRMCLHMQIIFFSFKNDIIKCLLLLFWLPPYGGIGDYVLNVWIMVVDRLATKMKRTKWNGNDFSLCLKQWCCVNCDHMNEQKNVAIHYSGFFFFFHFDER